MSDRIRFMAKPARNLFAEQYPALRPRTVRVRAANVVQLTRQRNGRSAEVLRVSGVLSAVAQPAPELPQGEDPMLSSARATSIILALSVLSLGACAKGDGGADTSAAGAPAAAASSEGGSGDISADEIRNYRLTMDRVRALHQAQLALAKDPAAQSEAKAAEADDDDDDDDDGDGEPTAAESADDVMEALEKRPATMAVFRKAGFTAREVAIHTTVLTYSALAVVGGEAKEVSAENVEFVKANLDELQRMGEQVEAATKARSSG
jgi:hypothetical protein